MENGRQLPIKTNKREAQIAHRQRKGENSGKIKIKVKGKKREDK